MKLSLAILAYVVMAAVLGWGVLLVMAGNPWLLIAGFVVYLIMMFRIGCVTH